MLPGQSHSIARMLFSDSPFCFYGVIEAISHDPRASTLVVGTLLAIA